jgi:hypothetical protein
MIFKTGSDTAFRPSFAPPRTQPGERRASTARRGALFHPRDAKSVEPEARRRQNGVAARVDPLPRYGEIGPAGFMFSPGHLFHFATFRKLRCLRTRRKLAIVFKWTRKLWRFIEMPNRVPTGLSGRVLAG